MSDSFDGLGDNYSLEDTHNIFRGLVTLIGTGEGDMMELNRIDKDIERNKEKAKFYNQEKLHAHVIKNPKGFINGFFLSGLINDSYYLFKDDRSEFGEVKLFLVDIFDIEDYRGVGE